MRSDDLTPVLAPPPGKAVTYRQGTVVSWNQETAENSILVGDSLMTDLPALNTSEASLLVPGDVVGILVSGSSWAVLGRLIIPGTADAATSIKAITNRIVAAEDPAPGTRNSATYGDLGGGAVVGPAVTIKIGASGRALAFWCCEIGQTVPYMEKNTPHVGVEVSGATAVAANAQNALNFALQFPASAFTGFALGSLWVQCASFHLFTGLNPGDNTFTLKYRHDGQLPSGASGEVTFQAREIAVFAL